MTTHQNQKNVRNNRLAKCLFHLDGVEVGDNHWLRHEPVSCVAQLPDSDNGDDDNDDDDTDDDDDDYDDVAQNTIMKLVVGIERELVQKIPFLMFV